MSQEPRLKKYILYIITLITTKLSSTLAFIDNDRNQQKMHKNGYEVMAKKFIAYWIQKQYVSKIHTNYHKDKRQPTSALYLHSVHQKRIHIEYGGQSEAIE